MSRKILIAEDHPMTLKGLRLLVDYLLTKEQVCEVYSCRLLMKELSATPYTHLILDIMLTDGSALEVIPTIRSLYPDLEIMIFTGQPAGLYTRALLRYRIAYILSKGMQETETMAQLRKFLTNEQRISDDVTILNGHSSAKKNPLIPFAGMPAREIDVLHYLLKGWRTNQIAETLNLSVSTISTLKSRIFERTQTSNIRELMDLATIHQVN